MLFYAILREIIAVFTPFSAELYYKARLARISEVFTYLRALADHTRNSALNSTREFYSCV